MAAVPGLTVVLSIFSGNPDPELALDQTAVADLADRLVRSLGQQAAQYVEPPGLGYRGFIVSNSGGVSGVPSVLGVYANTITAPDDTGEVRTWADLQQAEQFLLGQARQLGYGPILDQVGPGQPNV